MHNHRLRKRRISRYRVPRGVGLILFVLMMAAMLAQQHGYRVPYVTSPTQQTVQNEHNAHVERVIDGDTVVLADGERVRYIGMDTPELHPRDGGATPEPYAVEARDENVRLVEGKTAKLVFDEERRDQYGRLLAYVYVNDIFVNRHLIQQGLARAKAYPPNTRYHQEFEAAEAEARRARRGMWREDAR